MCCQDNRDTLFQMINEREESLKDCRTKIKELTSDNDFLEDLLVQYEEEIEVMVCTLKSILAETPSVFTARGKALQALEELGYIDHE